MKIFNKYLIVTIFLYIVHGVVCYPKQGRNSGNVNNQTNVIKKLPKVISNTRSNNSSPGIKSRNIYDVSKNIKKQNKNDEAHKITEQFAKLKNDINKNGAKKSNTRQNSKSNDNYQRNGDDLSGNINMKDENIEGEINLPDQPENLDNNEGRDSDTITGDIQVEEGGDIGDIEGTINMPYDITTDQQEPRENTNGKVGNEETIAGSIQMDENGSIEGELNLPDDVTNQQNPKKSTNDKVGNEETIAGSIQMDENGSIEGELNLPDDGTNQPNSKVSNNDKAGDEETIVGSIEMDDKGSIEGELNLPNDLIGLQNPMVSNNDNNNKDDNADTIVGSIEMDENGSIEGDLEMDLGNGNNETQTINGQVPNGDLSGDFVIDDEGNIEGQIDIDDEAKITTGNNGGPINSPQRPLDRPFPPSNGPNEKNCWMNLNSRKYLKELDEIDAKYSKARHQYQDEIGPDFDKQMMEVLMRAKGKAPRAVHQAHGNPSIIPAGLNLGGFGMMRMPGSMLFFHRMKLRNSTVFQVNFLQANLVDMTLMGRLSLNDLHLRGSYERATTEDDMSAMFFNPTFGELDVLIKSVDYKMEGRLRMLNNRLMIELINSDIVTKDILLSYANSSTAAKDIAYDNIEDFIARMKCDFDIWLKDYFNDYLMYFGIVGGGKNSEIQLYEKQKTITANEYADYAIRGIKQKIREIKSANVRLPSFTLMSVMNHRIELKNGVLRGLDSIYRRSVAMTKKEKNVRTLDMIVGFSNLKVEYQYEASVMRGTPLLTGLLILTADELTAHLELTQVDDAQTVDINIDSIIQLKSESLTVEGPANRLIADFKYILENPTIAIMTNVMKHNIKMLQTLTRCEPSLWGDNKEHNPYNDDTIQIPKNTGHKKKVYDKDNVKSYENNKPMDPIQLKEWSDYTFSKNDSIEIEVPLDGKMQLMKLNQWERHWKELNELRDRRWDMRKEEMRRVMQERWNDRKRQAEKRHKECQQQLQEGHTHKLCDDEFFEWQQHEKEVKVQENNQRQYHIALRNQWVEAVKEQETRFMNDRRIELEAQEKCDDKKYERWQDRQKAQLDRKKYEYDLLFRYELWEWKYHERQDHTNEERDRVKLEHEAYVREQQDWKELEIEELRWKEYDRQERKREKHEREEREREEREREEREREKREREEREREEREREEREREKRKREERDREEREREERKREELEREEREREKREREEREREEREREIEKREREKREREEREKREHEDREREKREREEREREEREREERKREVTDKPAIEETNEEDIDELTDEVTDEASNESTDDATDEATGEPTDEASDETGGEVTDETTKESTKESTDKATDETTVETTDELTDEASDETASEVTDEATQESTEESTDIATDEVTVETTDELTDEATDTANDESSVESTDEVTDEVTDEETDGVTEEETDEGTYETSDTETDEGTYETTDS